MRVQLAGGGCVVSWALVRGSSRRSRVVGGESEGRGEARRVDLRGRREVQGARSKVSGCVCTTAEEEEGRVCVCDVGTFYDVG
jgi:head-tail adaptor